MGKRKTWCNVCKDKGHMVQVEIYRGFEMSVIYQPIFLLEEGRRHQHRMF